MMLKWSVSLSDSAEADFADILSYTATTFGPKQAQTYLVTITRALAALDAGPDITGSTARSEILPGLRSLHVARARRKGRHFIVYLPADNYEIKVVRILHDAMELAQHIPQIDDTRKD
jgi:toxin ParE1/3/4